MSLLSDLKSKISGFQNERYTIEPTTIVPTSDLSKLTFGNKGLTCEFAFLFVDIRKSSQLVTTYGFEKAAKIYQSFHEINVRIIIANNGKIRAFDGDRIMGVFSGDSKRTGAVKSAMQIHWAVRHTLNPTFNSNIVCGAGVESGVTLVTKVGKGGNADNSDLIWVGAACNHASHLCNEANGSTIISMDTFENMHVSNKKSSDGKDIWHLKILTLKNGNKVNCYESSWEWGID